ncbi:MAG: CDGSH iron-sulfur domain-containing protein [Pseudomonadota bacterium]
MPKIAQKAPYKVSIEKDKKYAWCSCGLSANQPFCDGAHKGGEFSPVVFTAEESKDVYFCGCKHSTKGAFCDGSHSKL